MSKTFDVVRAWKDEEYRQGLGAAERQDLPDNPAGQVLDHDAAQDVAGGVATEYLSTFGCCGGFTLFTCYGSITPIGTICVSLDFCGS